MEIFNQTSFQCAPFPGRVNFPGNSLTLIVKGTFDLSFMGKAEVTNEQMPPTGDMLYQDDNEGKGSSFYESDFAYFKPRADLLLVGKCHAPNKKLVNFCPVTFQVGNYAKSLSVFGNRYWRVKGAMPWVSESEPFTEMDLRYENSFGGAENKKNPIGKGYKKEQNQKGREIICLPNIEDPKYFIRKPEDRPEPVGFGPLGRMWEQRVSKTGSFEGNWLKERWPWFPKDFDWGYFNAAPSDMQIEGYLKGNEALYLENLHSIHSQYQSQLPGLRVRCFLNKLDLNGINRTLFQEIQMNLDTLWVDMETEKLVLVWRGVATIRSEEYEEMKHLFIISEKLEEKAKSLDYYEGIFKKIRAEEAAEEDYQVKPIELVDELDTTDIDEERAKAEEQMRGAGIDPDNPPTQTKEEKERETQILRELGIEEKVAPFCLTRETVQERIARGESFTREDLRGIDLAGLEMIGVNFQEALLTGVNLKNSNLSDANLSKANVAGADFSGCILQKTLLNDADATGATFVGADLTKAALKEAIFDHANLKKANLDQVIATDANFSESNLSEASLKKASLQGADFSKSILDRANFQGSNLNEASVEGAMGIQVNMSEANLTELRASEGCNFMQANFQKSIGLESNWEKANLTEADFSFSNMEGADFSSATLEQANFSAAAMKFSRFTKANLRDAIFIQMNLFQGNLEKADLTRVDFGGSNLYGVEFLDAVVKETKFESANLKMTKFSNESVKLK